MLINSHDPFCLHLKIASKSEGFLPPFRNPHKVGGDVALPWDCICNGKRISVNDTAGGVNRGLPSEGIGGSN